MLQKLARSLTYNPSPARKQSITSWLIKNGVDVRELNQNDWRINLEHELATYSVTIKRSGMWLSYTAELMPDVQGQKVDEFYKLLLNINSRLSAAYIATQQNRLILIRNEFSQDINEKSFFRGLAVFERTHEQIYEKILKKAYELNLNLKNNLMNSPT